MEFYYIGQIGCLTSNLKIWGFGCRQGNFRGWKGRLQSYWPKSSPRMRCRNPWIDETLNRRSWYLILFIINGREGRINNLHRYSPTYTLMVYLRLPYVFLFPNDQFVIRYDTKTKFRSRNPGFLQVSLKDGNIDFNENFVDDFENHRFSQRKTICATGW